jgi:hypothetical protein
VRRYRPGTGGEPVHSYDPTPEPTHRRDYESCGERGRGGGAVVPDRRVARQRCWPRTLLPGGPDDGAAAAAWLAEHAVAEFRTGRLAIGGESAGASLAVVTWYGCASVASAAPSGRPTSSASAYDAALTSSCRA